MQMIEAYDDPSDEPISVDILALGGADDAGVKASRLNGWREFTTGRFAMRLFPGGHFFLHPPPRREVSSDDDPIPAPLEAILAVLPDNDELQP